MDNQSPLFQKFIDDYMQGDRKKAAESLGVSIALVGHVLTKRRGVSIPVAIRIEEITSGEISRHDLRPDVYGPAPERAA